MELRKNENANPLEALNPPLQILPLPVKKGRVFVVREDLLPGGTKQRAIVPFLRQLERMGYRHFIYASPFAGYAQVALSYVAQKLGFDCTLIVERDPQTGHMHDFTRLAQSYGAQIILRQTLTLAEEACTRLVSQNPLMFKLPLGFDSPLYKEFMRRELKERWRELRTKLTRTPDRLWLPVGSGVLTQIFAPLVGRSTLLTCLNVNVLPLDDPRIEHLRHLPNVTLLTAAQKFAEKVITPPPIPSNVHYDAKMWEFIYRDARDGDVWWNVAR